MKLLLTFCLTSIMAIQVFGKNEPIIDIIESLENTINHLASENLICETVDDCQKIWVGYLPRGGIISLGEESTSCDHPDAYTIVTSRHNPHHQAISTPELQDHSLARFRF